MYNQRFFQHIFWIRAFRILNRACTCGHLDGLACLCAYAGLTSPREGHQEGPPRVRLRFAGTIAGEANEKVHLASRKGLDERGAPGIPIRRLLASGYPTFMYNKKQASPVAHSVRKPVPTIHRGTDRSDSCCHRSQADTKEKPMNGKLTEVGK